MEEIKTLIWMKEKDLKNAGGAGGYLYNFKYYLNKNKIKNIYFLEEIEKERYRTFSIKIKNRVQKIQNFFIKDEINKVKNSILNTLLEDKKVLKRKLEKFDFIHFHSTKTLYRNLKNIENIKSKIILTSHSPQLLSMEEIESTNLEGELLKDRKFIDKFKKFDYIAFKRADYIIFPCEEAMEPYLKDEEMKKILLSKKKVTYFIPTGIIQNQLEEEEDYFYNKFRIPKNSIVISYIGRHNKIKGYDLLVEFGKRIIEKYKNVYFVIAGKEDGIIQKPMSNQWVECGWTTEGLKIMKNCDLFILPNRETYFDLIFLELLSQNTTILCSYTGGNKYFKKYNSSKILYFSNENLDEMIEKFEYLYFKIKNVKNNRENEILFKNNFSIEKFGEDYLKLIRKLYEE